ncbi:MAG: hypothetical protein ABSA01_08175 [Anaerolineales bacterium]|jgi:hypothetical protein
MAYDRSNQQPVFMLHFTYNQFVGVPWGEPDLAPILPWLGRYASWLEDQARLNRYRQAFMYVVTGKFADRASRMAREIEINANPPQPGLCWWKMKVRHGVSLLRSWHCMTPVKMD